jgi:acetyl-CoA carboxylase biotin carboxylase subunit
MSVPIRKILIANRGEIALRIIRACREMGMQTVAIYSDADRTAAHVRLADEAYPVGPPPSSQSYLVIDNVIAAARASGAQAIHPGYGFLSENEDFAERVAAEGLIFIGPPADAMRRMGNKTEARKLAKSIGVPTVPGTEEGIRSTDEARRIASSIGYPVLIKAAAGGGGKGMRLVEAPGELDAAIERAKGEALSAFGDDTVYIEKYVQKPRHIEIQILADRFGNTVYLGERECSIQRRHQKVIEEAPSCIVTPELRQRMGESAVRLAKACGYVNAGTLEFLVDHELNFYFLEMNTRLQVEHPVTEMTTGIDLVRQMIHIAAGDPLPFKQEDIKMTGHAIECRIYAEDVENNFAPSIGKIEHLEPSLGPGMREDSGVFEGDSVQIYYDPMLSKLIAWASDRQHAIERMRRSLREYAVVGVDTTIPFCLFVMENENFIKGNFDTSFVQKEFSAEKLRYKEEQMAAVAAALYDYVKRMKSSSEVISTPGNNDRSGAWKWKYR